jgi:hypothetical protein
VVLANGIIELGALSAIELTELRVLVAVGMLFPILTPELIERQIELLVGFKLTVDVIEIWQRFGRRLDRD